MSPAIPHVNSGTASYYGPLGKFDMDLSKPADKLKYEQTLEKGLGKPLVNFV